MALGQVNVPGAAGMDAVEAKQAAQAAKEAAEAAQRTAESAGKTADAAMQKAADAETAAGNADSKADAALDAANTAAGAATAAASAASAAEESANSANTAANEAKTAASNAQKAANDALKAVTKLTSVINSVPTQAGILTYTVPLVERVRHGEADHRRNDQRHQRRQLRCDLHAQGGLRVGRRHQDRQERDLDDQQGQPVRTRAERDADLHGKRTVSPVEQLRQQ